MLRSSFAHPYPLLCALLCLRMQREEAAVKRLVDSLQGGVVFFKPQKPTTTAASALPAVGPAGAAASAVVVSSLQQVSDVAHLDAIRGDRDGKAALKALLAAERMSLADLRRRLESVSASMCFQWNGGDV